MYVNFFQPSLLLQASGVYINCSPIKILIFSGEIEFDVNKFHAIEYTYFYTREFIWIFLQKLNKLLAHKYNEILMNKPTICNKKI